MANTSDKRKKPDTQEKDKQTAAAKATMLKCLENSLGVVTLACKAANLSRQTHYRWMKEDEEYKAAVRDVEDIAVDFAESQLHAQIKKGNAVATIFYLKTKGKKRGYVEAQEVITREATQPAAWFDDGEETA